MAPSGSMEEFRKVFQEAKFIVVLTGAGISAESGVPTFRGEGAYWRGYSIETIAMLSLFRQDPSLVWELYHFRREVVFPKTPNKAHLALTECQKRLEEEGKVMKIITQNIDELHTKAGSEDVIELHGTLFKTRCMECGDVAGNLDSPICPALDGKGTIIGPQLIFKIASAKEMGTPSANIPEEELPRCQNDGCKGLVRPHIVWFDEDPTDEHMRLTYEWLDKCDLMLIIGTSSVVPPANEFGPYVAARGVPVAEFNLEQTPATELYRVIITLVVPNMTRFLARFHITGPCGTTLPDALRG